MRRVAENALKKGSFVVPKGFVPNTILDLGIRTKFTSLEYASKFPSAQIYSGQCDPSNFLLDKNSLAYHDNIIFFSVFKATFDLDACFNYWPKIKYVDFLKMDLKGEEKRLFKEYDLWASRTKYIKARLGPNYHYLEAKQDLNRLGFKSWAMYDGYSFYVIGER